MIRRSSIAAVGLLLAVGLAGCASGSAQPAGPVGSTSAPASDLDAQAAHDRQRATDQARRLLAYAVIPPGATAQDDAPASLPGPALGMPGEQTYVDLARYYRLPLSLAAAVEFVRTHPPAGLIEAGSSTGSPGQTVGYAWDGPSGSSVQGQLSMVLAPIDTTSSYLRVDAGQYWLDPRPVKDDAAGARLRIEADEHCPASDAGVVGVRNPDIDLSRQLAPAATATGGLLCSYAGLNGNRFALLSGRPLTADEAGRLGSLAHQVDLSHSDGLRHCAMDDGSAAVLVLDYPGRPAVDLWLHQRGCTSVSNGQVMAGGNASTSALLNAAS
ncbi:MAG TPA: hypothetical protein VJ851_10715 [Jatrophihabitans sp.]|nr:hypothetical protein [Jatrophihabitans sp.]